jgi:hypothetical protein
MDVIQWPKELVPDAVRNAELKPIDTPLFRATSPDISSLSLNAPRVPGYDTRLGVRGLFAPLYFSGDKKTAENEYLYHFPEFPCALWKVEITISKCLDLASQQDRFLLRDHYFPWQFFAACILGAKIEAVQFQSYRGAGANYAIFHLSERAVKDVKKIK